MFIWFLFLYIIRNTSKSIDLEKFNFSKKVLKGTFVHQLIEFLILFINKVFVEWLEVFIP